jgi:hypothetical protein
VGAEAVVRVQRLYVMKEFADVSLNVFCGLVEGPYAVERQVAFHDDTSVSVRCAAKFP